VSRGFLFRVPEQCRECHAQGAVTLEQTLKGELVILRWRCRMCNADWSVMPSDHVERRRSRTDRRNTPRNERRRRSD
jgi:hypothetical protein